MPNIESGPIQDVNLIVGDEVVVTQGTAANCKVEPTQTDETKQYHAEWHEGARQLVKAIAVQPSARIRALMQQDLDELLLTNKTAIDATKIGL